MTEILTPVGLPKRSNFRVRCASCGRVYTTHGQRRAIEKRRECADCIHRLSNRMKVRRSKPRKKWAVNKDRLEIRVPPKLLIAIQFAATAAGISASEFVRQSVLQVISRAA